MAMIIIVTAVAIIKITFTVILIGLTPLRLARRLRDGTSRTVTSYRRDNAITLRSCPRVLVIRHRRRRKTMRANHRACCFPLSFATTINRYCCRLTVCTEEVYIR